MNFDEWIAFGIEKGWCGPPVCYTHDGLPMSTSEEEEFNEGDPCILLIIVSIWNFWGFCNPL